MRQRCGYRSVRLVQQIGVDNENVRGTLLAILGEIESPGWDSKFYAETLVTLLREPAHTMCVKSSRTAADALQEGRIAELAAKAGFGVARR